MPCYRPLPLMSTVPQFLSFSPLGKAGEHITCLTHVSPRGGHGRTLTELFLDFSDGSRLGDESLKARRGQPGGVLVLET